MHKENINLLATFIESHPELPFDMGKPSPVTCGSAGCIGGFAAALWPEIVGLIKFQCWDDALLASALGIPQDDVSLLCFPADNCNFADEDCEEGVRTMEYEQITRRGAISTLRRLASTGEVVWKEEEQI